MSDINIDTTAPAYTTRHSQFQSIVVFWRPIIKVWLKLDPEQQQAWRDNDPFLDDLLRFVEVVSSRIADDI